MSQFQASYKSVISRYKKSEKNHTSANQSASQSASQSEQDQPSVSQSARQSTSQTEQDQPSANQSARQSASQSKQDQPSANQSARQSASQSKQDQPSASSSTSQSASQTEPDIKPFNRSVNLSNFINYFSLYTIDISNDYLEPVEKKYWFKRAFYENHVYQLIEFCDSYKNIQNNAYTELLGSNGWISHYLYERDVTDDFLTGYYLAKTYLPFKQIVSFHFGCAQSQLIKGMSQYFKSKSIRWRWYGADKKLFDIALGPNNKTSNILNGITQTGNVLSLNDIQSIKIQLYEQYSQLITFYMCDIYPSVPYMLYTSILIPLTNVDKNGISIIRLPDPHNWSKYSVFLINFFTFIITQYHMVKIFKTPWGEKARYYLIFSQPKQKFHLDKYTSLIKYIEYQISNDIVPLFNKEYFNLVNNRQDYVSSLLNIQKRLIVHHEKITQQQAHQIWFDYVMNLHNKK